MSSWPSFYHPTARTMYGYPERGRGYRGRWNWHQESYRGDFGSFQHRAFPETGHFTDMRPFRGKPKRRFQRTFEDRGARAAKQMRTTAENKAAYQESESQDNNAENLVRTTMSDGELEEETEHMQSSSENTEETENWRLVRRKRLGCTLCRFHTLFSEEMKSHLQSEFHKEHLRYVGEKLPKKTVEFVQEYILHRNKKIEERRGFIDDATIQQLCQTLQFAKNFGMEHFMKKIEAAQCLACDLFVPLHVLNQHLNSPLHVQKCKVMMGKSKNMGLSALNAVLKQNIINQKLELYKKGQDPFIEDEEDGKSVSSTKAQEAGQVACSSLSDSDDLPSKVSTAPKSKKEVKKEDAAPSGQGLRGEDAEGYACEVF